MIKESAIVIKPSFSSFSLDQDELDELDSSHQSFEIEENGMRDKFKNSRLK